MRTEPPSGYPRKVTCSRWRPQLTERGQGFLLATEPQSHVVLGRDLRLLEEPLGRVRKPSPLVRSATWVAAPRLAGQSRSDRRKPASRRHSGGRAPGGGRSRRGAASPPAAARSGRLGARGPASAAPPATPLPQPAGRPAPAGPPAARVLIASRAGPSARPATARPSRSAGRASAGPR